MRLSLFSKGLLLVAVPISFQIIFVAVFFYLKSEADRDTQQAMKARHLSECLNRTTRNLYTLFILFEDTRHRDQNKAAKILAARYANGFTPVLRSLKEQHRELDRLTFDNKKLNLSVKKSAASIDSVSKIIDQSFAQISSGQVEDIPEYLSEQTKELRVSLDGLVSQELMLAAEEEHSFEETSLEGSKRLRDLLLYSMIGLCVINVLISAAQANFLFRNIISRLDLLSDNAIRVAQSQPLNEEIEGDDEIAGVDKAMHKMAESLEHTARSKQELINMLTHDLRSPLTSIKGSLDMLQLGTFGALTDKNMELVTIAGRNSNRMMNLIRDMLDVERLRDGMMALETERVSLQDMLDDVEVDVRGLAEKSQLKIEIDSDDIYIQADEEKLSRVLRNLVSNAIKFSPTHATIRLEATEATDGFAQVSVSDQGAGIPEDQLERVFERFQQGDNIEHRGAEGSSGLGLAICRAIVELHGGKIWVRSRKGQGSTFFVTIPLART